VPGVRSTRARTRPAPSGSCTGWTRPSPRTGGAPARRMSR